jgi:hypothetical protein
MDKGDDGIEEILKSFRKIAHPLYNHGALDPDYLTPRNEHLKEMITCSFCYNIVNTPVMCKNRDCSRLFCQQCVINFMSINNIRECPFRCQAGKLEVEGIPRNLRLILEGIQLNCLYKECDSEIHVKDWEIHNKEQCMFIKMECTCMFVGRREEMISHLKNCENFNGECIFCKKLFKFQELFDHTVKCEQTEECSLCKERIERVKIKEHEQNCLNYELECNFCKYIYKKSDQLNHDLNECFENTNKYNKFHLKYH